MKRFRYFLFVALAAVVTGLYLVSCGDDNDDENGGGNSATSQLVGTWQTVEDDGDVWYYMFCANGVAYDFSEDGSYGLEVDKQTYVYNEQSGKIIFVDGDESWVDQVLSISDTKLVIFSVSGSYTETNVFTKVNSPYTADMLERIYQTQRSKSY